MGFGGFFKKVAPWLAAGAEFVPGAGPGIAATLNGIAKTHNVVLPAPADDKLPETLENAAAAITGNADALAALKKQDQDYALQMQAAGFKQVEDLLALDNADRANARQMQEQTKSRIPQIIACCFVAGFFVVTALKLTHVITAADQTVNDLITTLRDGLMLILAYYYGSSHGQEAQSKALADIAKS